MSRTRTPAEDLNEFYKTLTTDIARQIDHYDSAAAELTDEFKSTLATDQTTTQGLQQRRHQFESKVRELSMIEQKGLAQIAEYEEQLQTSVNHLKQNKIVSAERRCSEAVLKAVKDSLKEYADHPPTGVAPADIDTLITAVNDLIAPLNSNTPYTEISAVIDSIFDRLYTRLQSGAHPFADLLDDHLKQLCTPPKGELSMTTGNVFKITWGTLSARKIEWDHDSITHAFADQVLANNIAIRTRDIQPEIQEAYDQAVKDLQAKKSEFDQLMTTANKTLVDIQPRLVQLGIEEAKTALHSAVHLAHDLQSKAHDAIKAITNIADEKFDHEDIVTALAKEVQLTTPEGKAYLKQQLNLIINSDQYEPTPGETRIWEKLSQNDDKAAKLGRELKEAIRELESIEITEANFKEARTTISSLLTTIQNTQKAIDHIKEEATALQHEFVNLFKQTIDNEMKEVQKEIDSMIAIVRSEKDHLSQKTFPLIHLQQPGATKKAAFIDDAIKRALAHAPDILIREPEERANYLLTTRFDDQPSIKDALEKSRFLAGTPHMYDRIVAKIENEVEGRPTPGKN